MQVQIAEIRSWCRQQEVNLAEQTRNEGVADDVLNCLHTKLPELAHGQVLWRS